MLKSHAWLIHACMTASVQSQAKAIWMYAGMHWLAAVTSHFLSYISIYVSSYLRAFCGDPSIIIFFMYVKANEKHQAVWWMDGACHVTTWTGAGCAVQHACLHGVDAAACTARDLLTWLACTKLCSTQQHIQKGRRHALASSHPITSWLVRQGTQAFGFVFS